MKSLGNNIEVLSLETIQSVQKSCLEVGIVVEDEDSSNGVKVNATYMNVENGKRNLVNNEGETVHTLDAIPIKHHQTNYLISYPSYMFGDFIQWLINQHNNFPHWQKLQMKPFGPTSAEIAWPYVGMVPRWFYFLDDLDHVYIEPTGGEERDFNVSKFASKIWNDGVPLSHERVADFQSPDVMGHTIDAKGIEKIRAVVPNTKCIQLWIEDLGSDAFHTYTKRTKKGESQRILMHLDDMELPDFVLCVDKIFALDDGEYKRLLDFIEEEPLDNWKEQVKVYTEQVML